MARELGPTGPITEATYAVIGVNRVGISPLTSGVASTMTQAYANRGGLSPDFTPTEDPHEPKKTFRAGTSIAAQDILSKIDMTSEEMKKKCSLEGAGERPQICAHNESRYSQEFRPEVCNACIFDQTVPNRTDVGVERALQVFQGSTLNEADIVSYVASISEEERRSQTPNKDLMMEYSLSPLYVRDQRVREIKAGAIRYRLQDSETESVSLPELVVKKPPIKIRSSQITPYGTSNAIIEQLPVVLSEDDVKAYEKATGVPAATTTQHYKELPGTHRAPFVNRIITTVSEFRAKQR